MIYFALTLLGSLFGYALGYYRGRKYMALDIAEQSELWAKLMREVD